MADDTVTITFNNDVISNGQGQTFVVTGNAVVDYTTNSYNYSWKLTRPDGEFVDGQEYTNMGLHKDANGNFVLGAGTFNTTYSGEQPGSAVSMVFTGLTPNYTGSGGSLTSTPGGTVTPPPAPCFVTGTMIRTTRGDVPVEALAVGDLAMTASGAVRPVVWIGHQLVGAAYAPVSEQVRPVRIATGAFGVGLPERELWLSPGHPVLVGADEDGEGGHLVPVMCLVNGTTIARMAVDSVTYWHVELDAHDILLAEGLPAESYLDWGDRVFFTGGADHALVNPDFVVPGLAGRCRPVAVDGPVVAAERRRLDAVFATQLISACDWPSSSDAVVLS